mgnify:CR=1 FL=1
MAKVTKKDEAVAETAETAAGAAETVTENKVTATKENPTTEKPQEKTGAVIYVGPPVKGTILHSTFIIFADGIPADYKQHPIFKHLFVPPERLDQARREIGTKGSLRNTYYKRAVEETTKKASDK